ncbi:MAG: hypothetical protein NDJ89_01260 [Oligoflexia bacterium]|nr:hypothetical protein [Oligoflexia bacterium]
MSTSLQEGIALTLVALAALVLVSRAFRKLLAEPLARWLLARGKVKWAMRIYPKFRPGLRKNSGTETDCCG